MIFMLLPVQLIALVLAVSEQDKPALADHISAWSLVSGPCKLDSQGCASSPNFPAAYGSDQKCSFRILRPSTLHVQNFHVESEFDTLQVDGKYYSGRKGPDGVLATSTISWSSDSDTAGTGWRICPDRAHPVALTEFQQKEKLDGSDELDSEEDASEWDQTHEENIGEAEYKSDAGQDTLTGELDIGGAQYNSDEGQGTLTGKLLAKAMKAIATENKLVKKLNKDFKKSERKDENADELGENEKRKTMQVDLQTSSAYESDEDKMRDDEDDDAGDGGSGKGYIKIYDGNKDFTDEDDDTLVSDDDDDGDEEDIPDAKDAEESDKEGDNAELANTLQKFLKVIQTPK